jgi:hypothetical protein
MARIPDQLDADFAAERRTQVELDRGSLDDVRGIVSSTPDC